MSTTCKPGWARATASRRWPGNLIGAILASAGSAAVGAGGNINLGTVTESATGSTAGQGTVGRVSTSREIGSVIQGQGDVRLAAGNDINIRASAVQSATGTLVAYWALLVETYLA